jgi:SAM-dependent methyltransferase
VREPNAELYVQGADMSSELGLATNPAQIMAGSSCPACGGNELDRFLEIRQLPVNCIALGATREAARSCPKADIELGFCGSCGAVSNVLFDPARLTYDPTYDNSLHFSATFQKYTDEIGRQLVERYDLHGKDIVDIGCGNAEFLSLLCSLGDNRGVGFDPTFIAGRANLAAGRGITIVPDYYSERHADYAADFVICRHVLEHIPKPQSFLGSVRAALAGKSDAAIFFEIPNASFVFTNDGMWDIIYEHCFYYSSGALARLFSSSGFDVWNVSSTFHGQYLCLEARVSPQDVGMLGEAAGDLESMRNDIRKFAREYGSRRAYWRETLQRFQAQSKRVALWGAGAKGAMFLNAFRDASSIEYIVDVNPYKWGLYIPGTGQRVVSPEFLKEFRPDVLVVVNSNYRDEINGQVRSLGIAPELLSI